MPTDPRVGLDNDWDFFPERPEPEERNPRGTIEGCEFGLRSFLSVCCELLAQNKLDDCLLFPTSEEGEAAVKKQRREIEQSPHGAR